MILDDFLTWEASIRDEINDVHSLLSHKLSDDPNGLINDLCVVETWNARIGSLLADANSWLDRSKRFLKPDKDFGSDLDRRTELDGATAPIRALRDNLESLLSAIKQRLILGESILRYWNQFKEHMMKEPVRPF